MRTVSWLFLILSFALGIGCAFIVRHYMFEAKPVQVVARQPVIKILVAKQTILQGAEITAEAITFVEVPITELPTAAITNFSQVYRRRSAYPISIGCPICEDLLQPYQEKNSETEKYVPAGMQIVSLEIEQILLNDKVVEPSLPIADRLLPDQRIDIRMFPREKSQGEFSERKNQLLKTYMLKNEVAEMGELLLENIEIHQIQRQFSSNNKQQQIQILTLVLEKDEAVQLTSAARKGRLRIVPHRQPNQTETSPIQNNTTINPDNPKNTVVDETANNNIKNITSDAANNTIDNMIDNLIDKTMETTADTTKETSLTSATSDSITPKITLHIPETFPKKSPSLLFVPPPEIPAAQPSVTQPSGEIHNDTHSVTATPLPGIYQEKTGIAKPLEDSKEKKDSEKRVPLYLLSPVIEIGLSATSEQEKLSKKNYSPWGQSSVVITPKIEPETNNNSNNNTLTQPLLRNRKNF
jgi:Flp pilus assembly protein CpaB